MSSPALRLDTNNRFFNIFFVGIFNFHFFLQGTDWNLMSNPLLCFRLPDVVTCEKDDKFSVFGFKKKNICRISFRWSIENILTTMVKWESEWIKNSIWTEKSFSINLKSTKEKNEKEERKRKNNKGRHGQVIIISRRYKTQAQSSTKMWLRVIIWDYLRNVNMIFWHAVRRSRKIIFQACTFLRSQELRKRS